MKKIIWKVSSKDINQASFRYRCLMPLRWMVDLEPGTRQIVADNSDITLINKDVRAIIFVKSFSAKDLLLAKKASLKKIPIYIDLCDNFFYRYKNDLYDNVTERIRLAESYKNFLEISSLAELIVTTGEELVDKIEKEFPQLRQKTMIIPDSIETKEDLEFAKNFNTNPKPYLDNNFFGKMLKIPKYILNKDAYVYVYWILRGRLQKRFGTRVVLKNKKTGKEELNSIAASPLKKVLWFGNAGIPDLYGMTDLLLIKNELLEAHRKRRFILIVCSSKKEIFEKHIAPIGIDCVYVDWSIDNNSELLKVVDVVVIPNPKNEFTIGKSANRALLSLSFKKPVIATYTPAMKDLSNLMKFDDWKLNLDTLLESAQEFESNWERDWRNISSAFSSINNARRWNEIFINSQVSQR